MRSYILLFFVAVIAMAQTGCGDGVALTKQERHARDKAIMDNDLKQMTDDWDSFWLNDRKGHLSRWRVE